MPDRAQVSSIEAIESFRAALIVYLAKARPVVGESSSDLRRIQHWIDNDQRLHWKTELRRRARILDEAQQALLSARLSSFQVALASEQMAVRRARTATAEAEEKLRLLHRWSRNFGPISQPLARPVDVLDTLLSQEMTRAVAFLTEIIGHLEAYTETRPDPAPLPGSATEMPSSPAPTAAPPTHANPADPPPSAESTDTP